ncbi:4415_t:CDS:2, partial [Scutellospora calospora]
RNSKEKRSKTSEHYFDEFCTRFWKRPITQFDQIRNTNLSIQRERERHQNCTPPSSYEEVTTTLNQQSSFNRQR